MRNVKEHSCKTEGEALNYLMTGNFNKKINATSLNQSSSRSHCLFTLTIRATDRLTLAELSSKVHLVDLAGSERVSKSQAEGIVLT
jgi:kinesin family protein 6/9